MTDKTEKPLLSRTKEELVAEIYKLQKQVKALTDAAASKLKNAKKPVSSKRIQM